MRMVENMAAFGDEHPNACACEDGLQEWLAVDLRNERDPELHRPRRFSGHASSHTTLPTALRRPWRLQKCCAGIAAILYLDNDRVR